MPYIYCSSIGSWLLKCMHTLAAMKQWLSFISKIWHLANEKFWRRKMSNTMKHHIIKGLVLTICSILPDNTLRYGNTCLQRNEKWRSCQEITSLQFSIPLSGHHLLHGLREGSKKEMKRLLKSKTWMLNWTQMSMQHMPKALRLVVSMHIYFLTFCNIV